MGTTEKRKGYHVFDRTHVVLDGTFKGEKNAKYNYFKRYTLN